MVIFLQILIAFLFILILFGFCDILNFSHEATSFILVIGLIFQVILAVIVIKGDTAILVMKAAVNAGVGIYQVNNEGEIKFCFIKPDGSEVYWMEELREIGTR